MCWKGCLKKPGYDKTTKKYVVEVASKTLYDLLKKPVNLDRLKKYIEHCGKCTGAFVRGFTDSEGSVSKRGQIHISNTDLQLLTYVKALLHRLGIESTGPKPNDRNGRKVCYRLFIRTSSNLRFYKTIGLTIERKRKCLEEYLRRRQPNLFPSFIPLF